MSYDERFAHMLSVAEQSYGLRTHQRTMLPVGFHVGFPQVFCPSPGTVEIRLPFGYKSEVELSCYMLAHECIHVLVLSPVSSHGATVLEEGLAMSFAHQYVRDHAAGDWTHSSELWTHSGDQRYDVARALVECFLATRPDAIRRLREREPIVSRISAKLISEMYPEVPASVARNLTIQFDAAPLSPPEPVWLASRGKT